MGHQQGRFAETRVCRLQLGHGRFWFLRARRALTKIVHYFRVRQTLYNKMWFLALLVYAFLYTWYITYFLHITEWGELGF
jgi:hypothetical protein